MNNTSYNMTSAGRGQGGGRGGRGRGQSSKTPRGKGGQNRGRGRGRGRGNKTGNTSKFNSSSSRDTSFVLDDEDDICGLALGQFELETSDVCKAIEEANAATELPGFDTDAGKIWIYPTNQPVRDYQFQIVQTALFNNTLVCLPTGLGKTFIAAVVMYNFHRWYPQDLIIFMAPTRPLVTQQLEACHNIVGIKPSKTIELTGQIIPKKREEFWKTKSVFFLTPQVLTSDLSKGVCPAGKVRCVVVDEAHKALGQHAYVQVISMLSKTNPFFRVLALSATPGSDVAAVQQVFKNLLISRVELRSETSPDILPYIHQRTIEKVVVPLDDYLKSVHDRLIEIYQVYTGKLLKQNAIHGRDPSSFTPFQLLKARETFRQTMGLKLPSYIKGYIEVDFATCISIAHALDLLIYHGLRSFYIYLQGVFSKEKGNATVSAELNRNTDMRSLLSTIKEKLKISSPNTSLNTSSLFTSFTNNLNSSSFLDDENQIDYSISHPKMIVLKEIILKHFKSFENRNETTRVMIFSQYRDSCQEIGNMLRTLGKLVKPMVFIGQSTTGGGKGLKQKDQVQVVQRFREGNFNVLVATCVAEEGLDIGEVDLIVCFDSSKSPTRLMQRMGRTGRKREGKIIFLLTKGKEERSYSAGFSLQNSISKNITDAGKLDPFLYKSSPRMVPNGLEPYCYKINCLLTSEQDQDDRNIDENDIITIDTTDDESKDAVKPATKPGARQKKGSSSKTATTKGKKAPNRSGKANASAASTSKTITQCFDELIQKTNSSLSTLTSLPQQGRRTNESVIIEEDHHPTYEYDLDDNMGIMIEDEYDDRDFLCDIFDVINPSDVEVKPCINIPEVPSKPILWKDEYNALDQELFLLNDFDMECLKRKLDDLSLMMPYKVKCKCGNVAVAKADSLKSQRLSMNPMDMMGFDDNDDFMFLQDEFFQTSETYEGSINGEDQNENSNDAPEELNMDQGFIIDENDPFFDDDWNGDDADIVDYDDLKKYSSLPEIPEKKFPLQVKVKQVPIPEKQKPTNQITKEYPQSSQYFPKFQSQNEQTTLALTSQNKITSSSWKEKILSRQTMGNCSPITFVDESFVDKSFGNLPGKNKDSPHPDDCGSSTTSNDDFGSPIRKPTSVSILPNKPSSNLMSPLLKVPKPELNLKNLVKPSESRFKFKFKPLTGLTLDTADLNPAIPISQNVEMDNKPISKPIPIPIKVIKDDDSSTSFEDDDEYLVPLSQNVKKAQTTIVTSTKDKESTQNENPVSSVSQSQSSQTRSQVNRELFKDDLLLFEDDDDDDFIEQIMAAESMYLPQAEPIPKPQPSNPPSTPIATSPIRKISPFESFAKPKPPSLRKDKKENITPPIFPISINQDSIFDDFDDDFVDFKIPKSNSNVSSSINDDDCGGGWIDMSKEGRSKPNIFEKSSKSKPNSTSQKSQTKKKICSTAKLTQLNYSTRSTSPVFGKNNRSIFSKNTNRNKSPPSATVTSSSSSSTLSKISLSEESPTTNSTSLISNDLTPIQERPIFKMPGFQTPEQTSVIILSDDDDDDDDFVIPPKRNVTPKNQSQNESFYKTPLSTSGLLGQSFRTSRNFGICNSTPRSLFASSPLPSSTSTKSVVKRKKKKRKLNNNPFLDIEAEVSDGDDSSLDEDDEFEGLDDDLDDSFVDQENSDMISDSQQIRYIRSVRDIEPILVERNEESPPPPVVDSPGARIFDEDDAEYDESDSFCVPEDEDVEFLEIGVFTQAMNVAKQQVLNENPNSAKRRQTRRHVRAKQYAMQTSSEVQSKTKKRRRIILNKSTSEEEQD